VSGSTQPPLYYGLDELPPTLGPVVAAIGVFDGVHRGHQAILATAAAQADAAGVACVAVTFDPHPAEVVRPGSHPAVLTSLPRRARLLGGAGADAVLVLPFTRALAQLSPQQFVADVLGGRLHAVAVVVGESFRFGHRAAGTVATLAELGARAAIAVTAVPLAGAGVPFSSTYVRQCVDEGDVVEAARVLGRPHRLEGEVVHGDHRGRALGYPTANLALAPHAAVPADGVYAGLLTDGDGPGQAAAISVGTNPTFDGTQRRVEAYVLDGVGLDLYGHHVGVDFVARLRGQLRFDSVPELVEQMARDVAATAALAAAGSLGAPPR